MGYNINGLFYDRTVLLKDGDNDAKGLGDVCGTTTCLIARFYGRDAL